MENKYTAPGPIFEPGPGWGEKLKKWSKKYILGWDCTLCRATRFVLIFGIVFLILARPGVNPQREQAEVDGNLIIETVRPRDGQTHLARRVLATYLEQEKIELTGGQKIFIENTLSAKIPEKLIEIGKKITIDAGEIKSAINQSKLLTASQLNKWEKYAKRVKFQ